MDSGVVVDELVQEPSSQDASLRGSPNRVVHCADAMKWLEEQSVLEGCSFITSMPDVAELSHLSLDQWKLWFKRAAVLVMSRCPDDGVAIFFQTDIKVDGTWLDKGHLVQCAAEEARMRLLWHKIVCRIEPGRQRFSRPGYSHMLCFSRSLCDRIHQSTADVIPDAGDVTWAKGMGTKACMAACQYVLKSTPTRTVVDPFCGHGTVLAVANFVGLGAIGVEIGAGRARQAQELVCNRNLVLEHGARRGLKPSAPGPSPLTVSPNGPP